MPGLRSLAVALALTALTAGVRAVTVEADPPEAGIVLVSSETPADGGSRVTLQARACPGFLFLYWSADQSATYDNFMLGRTSAVAPAGTAFLAHSVERIVELRRDMLGSRLERTAFRHRFERVAQARRITARGWLTPRAPRGVR
jgi:hypothetical protein